MKVGPERYYSRKTGEFKLPPCRIRYIFQCQVCTTMLERGPTLWVCPKDLSHCRGIHDGDLLRRLEAAIKRAGYKNLKAKRVLWKYKRVWFWKRFQEELAAKARRQAFCSKGQP